MGTCKYCGENAGLFKSHHKECQEANWQAYDQIVAGITQAGLGQWPIGQDHDEISEKGFLIPGQRQSALIEGWSNAVNEALDDHEISEEEELRLIDLKNQLGLTQEELSENGAYERMVKGIVLRKLLSGETPQNMKVEGQLPFNFQKSEDFIWAFQDVDYYEQKVIRERVGSSQGVSFRVARGVYVRSGSFKSKPVERIVTDHVDTGLLGITTKHIYFSGDFKKFRVPYNKIVSFDTYADGIGIMRDAASAKPQTFVTGDGWFTCNLVNILSDR